MSGQKDSPVDWKPHKAELQKLYLAEDRTLNYIMTYMKETHNFHATKAQYETQFRTWKFRKNLKGEEWDYVHCRLQKRKFDGKESEVYFNGELIPGKRVKKEVARRYPPTFRQCYNTASSPSPQGTISILTPKPSVDGNNDPEHSPSSDSRVAYQASTTTLNNSPEGFPITELSEAQAAQNATYAQFMKLKFARAPVKEAGRVAYLGESYNLSLLVHDRHGTTDVVHYPLPETVRGSRARLTELDNVEIEILHQRGAFLLPPRQLCDELVESYFEWVAPIVPVINRSRFMRRYRDPKNPPSLLLLQAILLAGSRVCTNPQLMDANGSTTPAAMTFYKRAKALYDANYEDDRVTIVQSLILMGWYWQEPEDVTKNEFYWSRVATAVAQGSGMHRSVESSQLSRPDKRLWKRIWWTLFTRDRSVAVAFGRPVHINTDDSDVEMVCADDFIDDDVDYPAEYPHDPIHVQFFLQYVKLCEIMGLVLSQQYSVASKQRRTNAIDLTHSDMTLADWLQNCPKDVYWERPRHRFWPALLHLNYYTTLCLLHRAHMPPATSQTSICRADDIASPSRTIAFQAANMITAIIENLQAHNELRSTPAFIVYSLFSALIMHVYQMHSSVPSVMSATQERIHLCMNALREVSKVWLVAKMVHTLFESILGNRVLEERLQKAAGKRNNKSKQNTAAQVQAATKKEEQTKRKYSEMDFGYTNGPPGPQVSYERLRPETPALTPSRELGQPQSVNTMGAPSQASPHMRQSSDSFIGGGNSHEDTDSTGPYMDQPVLHESSALDYQIEANRIGFVPNSLSFMSVAVSGLDTLTLPDGSAFDELLAGWFDPEMEVDTSNWDYLSHFQSQG